jgi:hypothetical protein
MNNGALGSWHVRFVLGARTRDADVWGPKNSSQLASWTTGLKKRVCVGQSMMLVCVCVCVCVCSRRYAECWVRRRLPFQPTGWESCTTVTLSPEAFQTYFRIQIEMKAFMCCSEAAGLVSGVERSIPNSEQNLYSLCELPMLIWLWKRLKPSFLLLHHLTKCSIGQWQAVGIYCVSLAFGTLAKSQRKRIPFLTFAYVLFPRADSVGDIVRKWTLEIFFLLKTI